MQTEQGNLLQSLRNVAGFLDQHADELSGVVKAGARQRLNDAISELESFASDQSGAHLGAKGATQKYRALRRALIRDHMLPVARIAVADLPDTPELHPFRLPAGRPLPERLAAAARGMADAASKSTSVFTNAGLPDDFVAQLPAAVDRMIVSLGERERSRVTHRGATEGLRSRLQVGRRIVGVLLIVFCQVAATIMTMVFSGVRLFRH